MQTATHHVTEARSGAYAGKYPPIELVTTATVDTAQAAHYLNRQSQTLRNWSSTQAGPLQPLRIHGRLAWRVADLRKLLEG